MIRMKEFVLTLEKEKLLDFSYPSKTLSSENIHRLLGKCLYKQKELDKLENPVPVEHIFIDGITRNFGFHPERIKKHQSEILAMIEQVNPDTMSDLGINKAGKKWTEDSSAVEELMVLGMAIKKIRYMSCRNDQWVIPQHTEVPFLMMF